MSMGNPLDLTESRDQVYEAVRRLLSRGGRGGDGPGRAHGIARSSWPTDTKATCGAAIPMSNQVADYACPECGYDGPHPVVGKEGDTVIAECGDSDCGYEFEVTNESPCTE